ncbi:hypothetical protein BC332_15874 [Capsicum chinense]|nr:hypothetical protein BC332_15874 [Capsicum chinense]
MKKLLVVLLAEERLPGNSRGAAKASSDLIAYKRINDLPPSREIIIQVDQKNEAILLPIYGTMVPFYMATVKTILSQQEVSFCSKDSRNISEVVQLIKTLRWNVMARESERAERATLMNR